MNGEASKLYEFVTNCPFTYVSPILKLEKNINHFKVLCKSIYHPRRRIGTGFETTDFQSVGLDYHDFHLSSFQKHHIRCDVFEKMIDVSDAFLTFPPLKRRVSKPVPILLRG